MSYLANRMVGVVRDLCNTNLSLASVVESMVSEGVSKRARRQQNTPGVLGVNTVASRATTHAVKIT